MQIHGSGAESWENKAVVDNSLGSQQGRLYTNALITQQVIAEPLNSSTINLLAGGSFVGSSINTLGVNAIQVTLKTDKNCIINVDQSPDGVNWDLTDSYNYYTGINNFGLTVQAVDAYTRVRVLNTNLTGSTSYFRLNTVLCPIAEVLPRSLDDRGHLITAVRDVQDYNGFIQKNTPTGELRVSEPYRLVGTTFTDDTLDPNFWVTSSGIGGNTIVSGGQLIISTGSTANNSTSLQSHRLGRYVGGATNRFRSSIKIEDNGTINNIRKWGAFDGNNGTYFKLNGSQLSINTLKYGVENSITNGSFNGELGLTYDLDNNFNVYEIYWDANKIWFNINDFLIHTFDADGTTWTSKLSLPIRFENNNISGLNSNINLHSKIATISRLGRDQTQPISKYQSGQISGLTLKYGAGNLHSLVIGNVANLANLTLTDNNTSGGGIIFSTGAMGAQTIPFSIDFMNLPFYSGLTLTIGGANCNTTIIYE